VVVALLAQGGSDNSSSQAQIAAGVRRALASTSTSTSAPPTTLATTTTPAPLATVPPPPPTTVPVPRGSVTYDKAALQGSGYSSGNCDHWNLRIINNSNTEVVQITFAPSSAHYWQHAPDYTNSHDVPAETPPPAVTDVSIPPYQAQVVSFQMCTSTPPPPEGGEFGVEYPRSFSWRWVTGQEGSSCFYMGC
jgi:hypothetical protein